MSDPHFTSLSQEREVMDTMEKHLLIARRIESILQKGLRIDPSVQHYIDSTFLNPTPEEFKEIIRDDTHPDGDTLLELLFFPDETIKIQIEELLGSESLDSATEEKLVSAIHATRKSVSFYFDTGEILPVPMSESAVHCFVSRLNLSRVLDSRVTAAIDQYIDDQYLNALVKVRLRSRIKTLQDYKIAFLCRFFEKISLQNRLFLESLDFILHFLNELKNRKDIYDELIHRKWLFFQNIQKAQMLEKKLQTSNMETLMMQGVRMTTTDVTEAHQKMESIDSICRTLFGRTEYFAATGLQVDSARLNSNDEIDEIIQKIS
jgi:hypothetical protein